MEYWKKQKKICVNPHNRETCVICVLSKRIAVLMRNYREPVDSKPL